MPGRGACRNLRWTPGHPSPTRKNMQADHIIKYHKDHPSMIPTLSGIKLTTGAPKDKGDLLKGVDYFRYLTGQMPTLLNAKKSVAGFNIRKGEEIQIIITVREKKNLRKLSDYILFVQRRFALAATGKSSTQISFAFLGQWCGQGPPTLGLRSGAQSQHAPATLPTGGHAQADHVQFGLSLIGADGYKAGNSGNIGGPVSNKSLAGKNSQQRPRDLVMGQDR